MTKVLKTLAITVVITIAVTFAYLTFAPPERLMVGTNYAAKTVCSAVNVGGRPLDAVMAEDVIPIDPSLQWVQANVDAETGLTTASLFGLFAKATAAYTPGAGCRNVYDDGDTAVLTGATKRPTTPATLETAPDPALQTILADDALFGPGGRAIVVLRDGKIVAERYAPGFTADTPLRGWSMTKTVTAAIIGRLEKQGIASRDESSLFPQWADDNRKNIAVADLLGMASDLSWNEAYGDVSDVTRMLYREAQPAAFNIARLLDTADGSQIGKAYNYSSGTSVVLTQYWVDRLAAAQAAGRTQIAPAETYPQTELFDPIGMTTAVMERAADTFVGGSYMLAPPREWALFGEFLLNKGRTRDGNQLLPDGYVDWMFEPHPASDGLYARGHMWRAPPRRREDRGEPTDPALDDVVWLAGHDGQSVAIIPEENLVIARMGQTPSKLGWRPENLTLAILAAIKD